MHANLKRAADYSCRHGLRLRPHTKTHKTPDLGRLQLQYGAAGLTVAKVGEAEVMAGQDVPDLLVAYPLWRESKIQRLLKVARNTPVTIALDSLECAEAISHGARQKGQQISILIEVDLGMRRCGLPPGDELKNLAHRLMGLDSLEFKGLLFYPGHINLADSTGEKSLIQLNEGLESLLANFTKSGIPTDVVSGGSTPTLYHSHRIHGLTEIRPGTYIFNDCTQVAMGASEWNNCAATIMTTVVSTPRQDAAIVDGGSKTFTSELARPVETKTYGHVLEAPKAGFTRMSEEHGILDFTAHEGQRVKIGDRLRIIPNHVCVAVNMHESIFGVRGETVEQIWKVKGRGKLQ